MNKKLEKRIRLKQKIRTKILGTSARPRLSVFRSNQYIYAQVIDDTKHTTILSASDLPKKAKKVAGADAKKKVSKAGKDGKKTDRAVLIGAEVAKALNAKGIKKVVFDRNGFKYTGRVKALADSARAAGLEF